MVVHFDWSSHFGHSNQKVPFNLTKLLSPVPLFCFLLTRTITKRMVAWVGYVPFHWAHEISEISNQIFPTHISNFFVSPGSVEVSG